MEIEGMKLRLEAAKEQQNVFLFCLTTAETKLGEIDIETAEKVRTSREARMAQIKEALGGKMSELDHRSAGTSFLTGEKLRELLPNAKETWDEWKGQREKLMAVMKESLGEGVVAKIMEGGGGVLSGTRG